MMLPCLLVWFFSLSYSCNSACVQKSALVCITVHDIFEDTGLNFCRVIAMSGATYCWRFGLAHCFSAGSIRSTMALLAEPSTVQGWRCCSFLKQCSLLYYLPCPSFPPPSPNVLNQIFQWAVY